MQHIGETNTKKQTEKYPLITDSYTSDHVANYFIQKAAKEDYPIDLLKLTKLCYLAYGWVLALMERRLFNEEVQAWRFGPVIPSVYHSFKHFEKNEITQLTPTIFIVIDENDNSNEQAIKYYLIKDDTKEGEILSIVWDTYKNHTGNNLIAMTHRAGGPWAESYNPQKRGTVIEDVVIKKHFDKIISDKLGNN